MDNIKLTFTNFLRKSWRIFVCLGILPIAALTTFLFLMAYEICDINDLGSMLGGFLAYCGTVILGAVTVWQVERQRQENIEAILQQNFDQNKGSLQVFIEVIYNNVILVVKNMGKSEIYNGSIIFDEAWIKQLSDFGDIASACKESIIKSLSSQIYLASNQEIRFLLYYIEANSSYYEFLFKNDCPISICYETLGKNVQQKLSLNFHSILASYYGLNIEEESVNTIEKIYGKQINEIKSIGSEIKKLNSNIATLNNKLSSIITDNNSNK